MVECRRALWLENFLFPTNPKLRGTLCLEGLLVYQQGERGRGIQNER